jgi:hypothetical protein
MAKAACKVIINNGLKAISTSLETILLHPLVRDKMLAAEKCDELIQCMADIDIATYQGRPIPHGGLIGIMKQLESAGVFTAEIWEVFAKPEEKTVGKFGDFPNGTTSVSSKDTTQYEK